MLPHDPAQKSGQHQDIRNLMTLFSSWIVTPMSEEAAIIALGRYSGLGDVVLARYSAEKKGCRATRFGCALNLTVYRRDLTALYSY